MRQILMIFGMTMLGEWLNFLLPLPIPAGVYGLFLLLVCLCTGMVKLEEVESGGSVLLDLMPLMFIPVSVGLMESYTQIKGIIIPFLVISLVSTIVVLAVTGKITQWLINDKKIQFK